MRIVLLLLAALALFTLPGCDLIDASEGSILGFVNFRHAEGESAILVQNGFVALYAEAAPETVVEVFPTDDLGRFNFFIPAGGYLLAGSSDADGPFTGKTEVFQLRGNRTARFAITIDEDPPPTAPN